MQLRYILVIAVIGTIAFVIEPTMASKRVDQRPSKYEVCACPFHYALVCGSDGVTYSNQCALECARERDPKIRLASDGPCETIPCGCGKIRNPVCGSNGVDYKNLCELECQQLNKSKWLHLATMDVCRRSQSQHVTIPCGCEEIRAPVCGSDGLTYSNLCKLVCKRLNEDWELKVASKGECKK